MSHPTPEMNTEGDILGVRIAAAIIDLIVVGILSSIIGLFFDSLIAMNTLNLLILVLYFTILEGEYGQTVGKRLLSIVVVKEDGSSCTMGSSAIRNVLRLIDLIPVFYLLGLVVILLTDRSQRVGDLAGGTVVVRTE